MNYFNRLEVSESAGKFYKGLFFFGVYMLYIIVADRSPTLLKIGKGFSWNAFLFLILLICLGGCLSLKDTEQGGFLNRHQTNEWKGWMQFLILAYHYVGASKISIVYNFVRVLVASYLFMTGYGHFSYFLKKKDFGIHRILKVLLRLNLLALSLSYIMEQPLTFYYFAPLVSFWFLVVYLTMLIGHQYNSDGRILFCKIVISMFLTWIFINSIDILGDLLNVSRYVFGIDDWNSKESQFRLALDQWIVYVGIFVSWAAIEFNKYSGSIPLTTSLSFKDRLFAFPNQNAENWIRMKNITGYCSVASILLFFAFDFLIPSKFIYNAYHPIVSIAPVVGYIILRNWNDACRRYYSELWSWIGKMSLETFLLQVIL